MSVRPEVVSYPQPRIPLPRKRLTTAPGRRALDTSSPDNRTMPFVALHALLTLAVPLLQDQVVAPPPRLPLPRPVANAPIAEANQNRVPAGRLAKNTLTLSLDVVEAGYRPEGSDDPVVRILALAEPGKTPQVPGPLLRAPVGTMVRLTLRNQSDSALTFSCFRQTSKADDDTVQLAARATRELTFRLDAVGT